MLHRTKKQYVLRHFSWTLISHQTTSPAGQAGPPLPPPAIIVVVVVVVVVVGRRGQRGGGAASADRVAGGGGFVQAPAPNMSKVNGGGDLTKVAAVSQK